MLQTANIMPGDLKKKVKFSHECPICKEKISFGIEKRFLDQEIPRFPFAHAVVHAGLDHNLHVLIAYIDANFQVRGIEPIESVEISRDGTTFSNIMKKWSNPF